MLFRSFLRCPRQAYDIVKTLLRYKINEFKLTPKLFMSCNPSQNWLKQEFYLKHMDDSLEPHKVFIQALPQDNMYLPESYLTILKNLPPAQRARLYNGSWDYETDNGLFDFDIINKSLYQAQPNPNDKKYMTIDVARFGDDRSVVMIWVGLVVTECHIYRKLSAVDLVDQIKILASGYGIHPTNMILDADGVGGPVADMLRATNFINNAKPLHNQNFSNLKSQCYVKLSELLKEGKISINLIEPIMIDDFTQ